MSGWMTLARKGAAAGGLATLCMSALMLLSKKAGVEREMPPILIAKEALKAGGESRPSVEKVCLVAAAMHAGFGLSSGAAFALLTRRRSARALPGMAYGLGLWLIGYKCIVPSLGLMPAADRDRPGPTWTNVIAHLVYGAALGTCMDWFEGGGQDERKVLPPALHSHY